MKMIKDDYNVEECNHADYCHQEKMDSMTDEEHARYRGYVLSKENKKCPQVEIMELKEALKAAVKLVEGK